MENHTHPLFVRLDNSGIWEGFIPDICKGETYKYHIHGYEGFSLIKVILLQIIGNNGPLLHPLPGELDYDWKDDEWMKNRKKHNSLECTMECL